MRKIIHCDCDSFYASVEMRDDPTLRNQPIAVGGRPNQRGVVATCNYNARAFGVHSAMPMSQALRLCPSLVVVPTNMKKYKTESAKVQAIFHDYTELVEPLSLDEAFLDVSESERFQGSATRLAQHIRQRVSDEVGITISAGIAPNKFLAKIASDWNKPNGQFTIAPNDVDTFVAKLPVAKLFGVGAVTAKKMSDMGITDCSHLQQKSAAELGAAFGKFGARLHELCRGIDDRPVRIHRIRKSLSAERTYAADLRDKTACHAALGDLYEELLKRLDRANCRELIQGRTLKMRFKGFETTTVAAAGKSVELADYKRLLNTAWAREKKPVRLLGIGVKLARLEETKQIDWLESE